MAARRTRHGTNFAITTVSLFVILVVINVFSYRHFVRWDLTENSDYSLSKTTRNLLGGLENIVTVKVYLSKNLPAALSTFEQQLRELLAEFETYGKGRLRIQYITPGNDPQTQQDLMIQGVQPQGVGVFRRDTSTQTFVFNSIVVEFEGRRQVIRSLLENVAGNRLELIGDFEYLLTSSVFRVQRTGRDVIGWLGSGPDPLDKNYSILRQIVRKEWDSRDVRFEPPMRIGNDISVLVVVDPHSLTDAQLFEMDQYLMRGGKMMAFVETYSRQTRNEGLEALVSQPTNFTKLLERYGIRVKDEIVLDPVCAKAPVSRFALMSYEFWVNVMSAGLNKDIPAIARLGKLTLPWTQPLDRASSVPEGVQMITLARSSPEARVRWGPRVNADPRVPQKDTSTQRTSYTLIAALSGSFPSDFPQGTASPNAGTTPTLTVTTEQERKYRSPETQIVVVGNTTFLTNDFLNFSRFEPNNNVAFFQNTIEWMALGRDLGQIRTRNPVGRPVKPEIMKETSAGLRNRYKILGTFAVPVLLVAGGLVYNTMIRRRRRRAIADRLLGLRNRNA